MPFHDLHTLSHVSSDHLLPGDRGPAGLLLWQLHSYETWMGAAAAEKWSETTFFKEDMSGVRSGNSQSSYRWPDKER